MQGLNRQVKEIAEKTLPAKFLFGSDLGEQIKAAKVLEKTGKEHRRRTQNLQRLLALEVQRKKRGGATFLIQNKAGKPTEAGSSTEGDETANGLSSLTGVPTALQGKK